MFTPTLLDLTLPFGPARVAAARLPAECRVEPGRTFLLVHGNPASLHHWAALVPFLVQHGDVVLFDMPGFGASPRPAFSLSLDHLADTALAVAQHFGVTTPLSVIGHSHGGAVAQTIAARHPAQTRELVCMSTTGHPASWTYRMFGLPAVGKLFVAAARATTLPGLGAVPRRIVEAMARVTFAPEQPPAGFVDAELAELAPDPAKLQSIARSMIEVAHGNPSGQLLAQCAAIQVPTLFLHGSVDALGGPERKLATILERMRAAKLQVTLEILHGAGHMLPTTRVDLVSAALLRWWQGSARNQER